MKYYIKNMVCDRCKLVVKSELEQMGLHPVNIKLGEIEILEELSISEKENLNNTLVRLGFSLIDDKKSLLIENVKRIIINLVHQNNGELKVNLSDYLTTQIHHDYNYISNTFSDSEGITIEKYFIAQKIERVKELLVYDELTLSEIAYQLNYSSVAHLSGQFKKITGLTPSHFKNIGLEKRKPLDKV